MVSMTDERVAVTILNHIGYRLRGHGGASMVYKKLNDAAAKEDKTGKKVFDEAVIKIGNSKIFPINATQATAYLRKLGFTDKQMTYHGGPVRMYRELVYAGLATIYFEGPSVVNVRYEDISRARHRK